MKSAIRFSTIVSLSASVMSGVALFLVSQGVQQAEDDVYRLRNAAVFEKKAEAVLRAEWDYLNSPLRLENMASEYLGMVPPVTEHVTTSTSLFPDYAAPVVPQRRPESLLKDAVFDQGSIGAEGGAAQGGARSILSPPESAAAPPRPTRRPSPATLQQGDDFDDLLGRIVGAQEGEGR